MASVLSSLRYLLADVIGDDDAPPPSLPDGLPDGAAAVVSDTIHRLIDYQGPSYAQLYVDRLRRFIGRRGVDDAMLGEIARLMAMRVGWVHKPVSIRFSAASRWGVRRLKIETALRRWRLFSVRYGKERLWVERWLHMIDRSLTKQPKAASEIVQTATMVQGYSDAYRQGLADWHAIIDGLAKPTFDGVLPHADLAAAIAEARAAARPDPRQAALKRTIAEIRARAAGSGANAAAG